MYVGVEQGKLREFSVCHGVNVLSPDTFAFCAWQAFTAPSVGYCKAHGAPAHSCYMYSVSDDRYLKVSR